MPICGRRWTNRSIGITLPGSGCAVIPAIRVTRRPINWPTAVWMKRGQRSMRSVVLDTETTGMPVADGHRIIEIGCVELIGRRLTGRHFHVYLQPDREIDEGAIAVHGITNDFVKDKPRFKEVADEFFDFIKGAQLIIHNAAFDVGFINNEFALIKQDDRALDEFEE